MTKRVKKTDVNCEHMKSKQDHPQGLPCSWVAG